MESDLEEHILKFLEWPWSGCSPTSELPDVRDVGEIIWNGNSRVLSRDALAAELGRGDAAYAGRTDTGAVFELPQPWRSDLHLRVGARAVVRPKFSGFCSDTVVEEGRRLDSTSALRVRGWWETIGSLTRDRRRAMWSDVVVNLEERRESKEPRRALIVEIAEALGGSILDRARHLRRILIRDRQLVPLHRFREMDLECIRWYVRQPGVTLAEKAGTRQELRSVVRTETRDTLENRVLLDFLRRSQRASEEYTRSLRKDQMSSERALLVRRLRHGAHAASQLGEFEGVGRPGPRPKANYVLQFDPRYREIWEWYQRLLRSDDARDDAWRWQTRVWGDCCRMMLGAAVTMLDDSAPDSRTRLIPLRPSDLEISDRGHQGRRLLMGWEPSPRVVRVGGRPRLVVSVISGTRAHRHPVARLASPLGATAYLVAEPVDSSRSPSIFAVWSVNASGVTEAPSMGAVLESLRHSLNRWSNDHATFVRGCLLTAGVSANLSTPPTGRLVALDAGDPESWPECVIDMASLIESFVEEVL